MKNGRLTIAVVAVVAMAALAVTAIAEEEHVVGIKPTEDGIKSGIKAPGYSPYAGRNFPTEVLWGDTHLHTSLSLDARAFGVILGPAEAYQFARGDEITTTHGERIQLSRPLDWLVVSDHSDGIGAMNEVVAGNPDLMRDPVCRDWHKRLKQGGNTALMATMEIIETFAGISGKPIPEVISDEKLVRSVWEDYLETAEEYNDPGRFTTIIGYEWTPTENGMNLHRNVLYRDGFYEARQMLPFTTESSFNPEDLWKWMGAYEEKTGGRVLALAHNGNCSNGIMFPEINPETGKPITEAYAKIRAKYEPIYEVTQIKGDGETHPFLSPEDEFADYETWDKGGLGPVVKENEMLQYEYARSALKIGLELKKKLGINPYKFGMVGSTDSHTGLATAEEENFFGKHSGKEPHPGRWKALIGEFGPVKYYGWEQASSGLAAVWARENTREALFDAMMRKEVYATTGPRMTVWFFGGWEFTEDHAELRKPGQIGYSLGVSMGGDLSKAPRGKKAPSFLVAALRDPYSGNLERIQIVKGWLDKKGKTHEKVYDVVWAGDRKPDSKGKLPPVGNTVDVKNATYKNSIGSPELITVWEDPDFDPKESAFYYARVIEIPTPRWTAYDAKRFGDKMSDEVPMTTQERAYTSPIWYTPK